jgi:hypothetical protein
MIFRSDIDIDFKDRTQILEHIQTTPAGIIRNGHLIKHNTGVYPVKVPVDPVVGCCSLDHKVAEERGYTKIDLLNVGVYSMVRDESHLVELMLREPNWTRLSDREFCEQIIHIGNHFDTIAKMPEPIDSILKMAMMLAVIRPAKRHLIGKRWAEVAKTVWDKSDDGSYAFKRSHSVSYSHLVVVHMNLIDEGKAAAT